MQPAELIEYRFLSETDFDGLYRSFIAAFSDYTVSMRSSADAFRNRLHRDGVKLELSMGAFSDREMVGFCINGLGQWHGRPTAYDAGTGIVPNYRGKGLAKELFAYVLPRLKEAGLNQYLLEVITSNTPAVNLYHKLGFNETRIFAVYKQNQRLTDTNSNKEIQLSDVDTPNWPLYESFWDGEPSWQNSIPAIKRSRGGNIFVTANLRGECAGYGVMSMITGNVMQLAVAPKHRRKGIGSLILTAFQNRLPSGEFLKVTNLDRTMAGALRFYEAKGFSLVLEQLEMMRYL